MKRFSLVIAIVFALFAVKAFAMKPMEEEQLAQCRAQTGLDVSMGMNVQVDELKIGSNYGAANDGGWFGFQDVAVHSPTLIDIGPPRVYAPWEWNWVVDWGSDAAGNGQLRIDSTEAGNVFVGIPTIMVQNTYDSTDARFREHRIAGLYLYDGVLTDDGTGVLNRFLISGDDDGINMSLTFGIEDGYLVIADEDGMPGYPAAAFAGVKGVHIWDMLTHGPTTLFNFTLDAGTNASGDSVVRLTHHGFSGVEFGGSELLIIDGLDRGGTLFEDFYLQNLAHDDMGGTNHNVFEIYPDPNSTGFVFHPWVSLTTDRMVITADGMSGAPNDAILSAEGWSYDNDGAGGVVDMGAWAFTVWTDKAGLFGTAQKPYIKMSASENSSDVNLGELAFDNLFIEDKSYLDSNGDGVWEPPSSFGTPSGPPLYDRDARLSRSIGGLALRDLSFSPTSGGSYNYLLLSSPDYVGQPYGKGITLCGYVEVTDGSISWSDSDGGYLNPATGGGFSFRDLKVTGTSGAGSAFKIQDWDVHLGSYATSPTTAEARVGVIIPDTTLRVEMISQLGNGSSSLPAPSANNPRLFRHVISGTFNATLTLGGQ